jgi:hypothetical protein
MKQLHNRVITASDKVRYVELAPASYVAFAGEANGSWELPIQRGMPGLYQLR